MRGFVGISNPYLCRDRITRIITVPGNTKIHRFRHFNPACCCLLGPGSGEPRAHSDVPFLFPALLMTLDEFNALPSDQQLATVYATGRFLLTRWEPTTAVNLYVLPGELLVELFYDPAANAIRSLRSLDPTAPLADYAPFVPLPAELG